MRTWRGDEGPEERAAAAELAGSSAWSEPRVIALAQACLRDAERRQCEAVGYTLALAYLDACLCVVQSLPYVPDGAVDALRSPAETLAAGGDCEDLAALLVALVCSGRRALGLPVGASVVWIRQREAPQDHVSAWVWVRPPGDRSAGALAPAAQVIDRGTDPPRGVWWAETTIRAARGESPYAAVQRRGGGHDRITG